MVVNSGIHESKLRQEEKDELYENIDSYSQN